MIYLTGVPGSGKTTATSYLESIFDHLKVIRYGEVIQEKLEARNEGLEYSELRNLSSSVVSETDLVEVDQVVYNRVQELRLDNDVIIESHGVTREDYGFRVTPFKSSVDFLQLSIHCVVYISSNSDMILERVAKDGGGRKVVNFDQLELNKRTQESLALIYASSSGCPLYIIENNDSYTSFIDRLKLTFSKILNR